jgi:tRNA pseudouridine13 synthase
MLLKSKPEDFIVDEINKLDFNKDGKYAYYKLKKINMDTLKALQLIANEFKINKKYINIAGTKDKVAVTTQYISISKGPEKSFKKDNLELQFLGKAKHRLNLGMLDGNKFTITVRELKNEEIQAFKNKKSNTTIPNYYDDQRFGIQKNNHIIGRLIVKKKFKEAVKEAIKQQHYPNNLMLPHLEKHPTDFIGALRKLPKRIVLMYIYAYQSYLWNETVKILIKKHNHHKASYNAGELFFPNDEIQNVDIPLIGFDMEYKNEEIKTTCEAIMKQEEITSRDFIIRQMPECSASGGNRSFLIDIKNLSAKEIDNETMQLCFSLGKGSYATMVVKALFA